MKRILPILAVCLTACNPDGPTKPVIVDGGGTESSQTTRPRHTKAPDSEDLTYDLYELPNGLVLEVRDSLYYWDDMVFTESGLNYLCPGHNRAAYIDRTNFFWPYGRVYYSFNTNLPSTSTINTAMNELANNSGLVFMPKTSTSTHYIEFNYSSANNSEVGMQSGGQTVNLYNYNDKVAIEHEIMHALGFFHEQSRVDRDNDIIIKWLNINPLKWHNFQKYNFLGQNSGIDFQSFDFYSIMLYPSYTTDTNFAIDITKPIMTRTDGTTFSGGNALSAGDISGIQSIYGPPYHRLEHHLIRVVEDSTSGNSERYITENADSLVFYADKNCTIRQASSYPRLIGSTLSREYCDSNGLQTEDSVSTLTIPAGTTSICIHHWYDYYIYYNSDPAIGYDVYNYSIINRLVSDI